MKDESIKKEWHYGFRAHIICDAKYRLSIKKKVTPENNSDPKELDNMIEEMETNEKNSFQNS